MYFCVNVSYSSLPVFLPTIIQDMGYTSINAQGLSAPPSFAAFEVASGMDAPGRPVSVAEKPNCGVRCRARLGIGGRR